MTVSVTATVTSSLTALPVLTICPASTSAWVTVCVPARAQTPPGPTVAQVLVFGVSSGSLTVTARKVTLPVLVAVTVYVSTTPGASGVALWPVSALSTASAGFWVVNDHQSPPSASVLTFSASIARTCQ